MLPLYEDGGEHLQCSPPPPPLNIQIYSSLSLHIKLLVYMTGNTMQTSWNHLFNKHGSGVGLTSEQPLLSPHTFTAYIGGDGEHLQGPMIDASVLWVAVQIVI